MNVNIWNKIAVAQSDFMESLAELEVLDTALALQASNEKEIQRLLDKLCRTVAEEVTGARAFPIFGESRKKPRGDVARAAVEAALNGAEPGGAA